MKCKACDYEGPAEVGDYGVDPEFKWIKQHYRCSMCKSTDIQYIDQGDHIEAFIRFGENCSGPERPHEPRKKEISITPNYYSIYCPFCGFGEGGSWSKEDYERAKTVRDCLSKVP